MMLAALRDRTMMPDGSLVPWTSPAGTPMEIAAAAPKIGWSDLAYALTPTGRTLDFRSRNPYGSSSRRREGLLPPGPLRGRAPGYYAPPGADPEADITNWKAEFDGGEPYDQALIDEILRQFQTLPLRLLPAARPAGAEREAPAPLVIYNGWNDDIMPASEALRFYNLTQAQYPEGPLGLVFGDELAHPRGSLTADAAMLNEERDGALRPLPQGQQGGQAARRRDDEDAGLRRLAAARPVPDRAAGPASTPAWSCSAARASGLRLFRRRCGDRHRDRPLLRRPPAGSSPPSAIPAPRPT